VSRWTAAYRRLLTTPARAVAGICAGETVYMGGIAATPKALARALADHAGRCPGVAVGHVLLLGEDPFATQGAKGLIRHLSWFVGPADRSSAEDETPCGPWGTRTEWHATGLSLGNLIGSNITDPLLSLGLGAAVHTVLVEVATLTVDFPWWAAARSLRC